jgi:acyl-CoA synthetase (NDP forming)
MFTEGLRDGHRLNALVQRAKAQGVVLIALKSGNSPLGQLAAASHTGKVATDSSIYRAVFDQAGIIEVAGLSEMIEAAELFANTRLPRNSESPDGGVAVYSIPGGTRALTADLCAHHGVPLAVFTDATVSSLQTQLPAFGQARNPTDMTGQLLSNPAMFNATLEQVACDPNTEALIVQLANRGPADAVTYQQTIQAAGAKAGIPVVISFLGDALNGAERRRFGEQGIACARDPNQAVRWLDWLYQARSHRDRPPRQAVPWPSALKERSRGPAGDLADHAVQMQWLDAAGIRSARWTLLHQSTSAASVAAELSFPVAVKALSRDAEHKTEHGLLVLGVQDEAGLVQAAGQLRARLGRPEASLLVQEMAPAGIEVVVSAFRNADFGTVLAIGSGGVLVELLSDLTYLALPCDRAEVKRALSRLKLYRLLQGFRGQPAGDIEALIDTVMRLASLAQACPAREIELNPLIVLAEGQGAVAVDCIMRP